MPSMIIAWIMFAITLPFCLLLLLLVCFHINLIRLGVTTYEFIMRQRLEDQRKMDHSEEEKPEVLNKT
jgi:hypothetical protein